MQPTYRKIFGDPAKYQRFALTEEECVALRNALPALKGELREFVMEQSSFIDAHGADLPGEEKIAHVLRRIEGEESKLFFDAPDVSAIQHGQKFSGERIGLWSVPRTSGALLSRIVAHVRPKRVIEIGTSAGYSTIWMVEGFRLSGAKGAIDTIDSFFEKVKLAQHNFEEAGVENVTRLHQEDALTYLIAQPDVSADFIFLDADKERYGTYLREIRRILAPGGLVIADNMYDFGHQMADYLEELRRARDFSSLLIERDNGLILSRKN